MRLEGEERVVNQFIGSSMKIAKLLDQGKFKQAGLCNVRSNFKMGYLTIEINNEQYMEELLEINIISEYKVKCTEPISHVESKGVLGPMGVHNTEEDIRELINAQNECKVDKVIRLNSGKEKVPTTAVKLVFVMSALPQYTKINYEYFKVREFVESPLQCHRCQACGHSSRSCYGKRGVLYVQEIIS